MNDRKTISLSFLINMHLPFKIIYNLENYLLKSFTMFVTCVHVCVCDAFALAAPNRFHFGCADQFTPHAVP